MMHLSMSLIAREGGKGPSQIGHRARFPAWYNPIIPYI